MALIDVSDLLRDPDFTNVVTLIRRTSTINTHGEHEMTESPCNIVASVQGINTEDLVRLPEGARREMDEDDSRVGNVFAQQLRDG